MGAHGLWQVEELREEVERCKQHDRGSAERARAVLQVRDEWQPSVRSLLGKLADDEKDDLYFEGGEHKLEMQVSGRCPSTRL